MHQGPGIRAWEHKIFTRQQLLVFCLHSMMCRFGWCMLRACRSACSVLHRRTKKMAAWEPARCCWLVGAEPQTRAAPAFSSPGRRQRSPGRPGSLPATEAPRRWSSSGNTEEMEHGRTGTVVPRREAARLLTRWVQVVPFGGLEWRAKFYHLRRGKPESGARYGGAESATGAAAPAPEAAGTAAGLYVVVHLHAL